MSDEPIQSDRALHPMKRANRSKTIVRSGFSGRQEVTWPAYAKWKNTHGAHGNHSCRRLHVFWCPVAKLSRLAHPAHERRQTEPDCSCTPSERQAGYVWSLAGGTQSRERMGQCSREGVHSFAA